MIYEVARREYGLARRTGAQESEAPLYLVLMTCGWLACRWLDHNIRSHGAYTAGARRWGKQSPHRLLYKVPVQPGEEISVYVREARRLVFASVCLHFSLGQCFPWTDWMAALRLTTGQTLSRLQGYKILFLPLIYVTSLAASVPWHVGQRHTVKLLQVCKANQALKCCICSALASLSRKSGSDGPLGSGKTWPEIQGPQGQTHWQWMC